MKQVYEFDAPIAGRICLTNLLPGKEFHLFMETEDGNHITVKDMDNRPAVLTHRNTCAKIDVPGNYAIFANCPSGLAEFSFVPAEMAEQVPPPPPYEILGEESVDGGANLTVPSGAQYAEIHVWSTGLGIVHTLTGTEPDITTSTGVRIPDGGFINLYTHVSLQGFKWKPIDKEASLYVVYFNRPPQNAG